MTQTAECQSVNVTNNKTYVSTEHKGSTNCTNKCLRHSFVLTVGKVCRLLPCTPGHEHAQKQKNSPILLSKLNQKQLLLTVAMLTLTWPKL